MSARKGEPGDDDVLVRTIEVSFAIPVYIPIAAMQELDQLLSDIVRLKANQVAGHLHWVSGHGSKANWSQADQRFLGLPVDPGAPPIGEPTFDDDVYAIETSCRKAFAGEETR